MMYIYFVGDSGIRIEYPFLPMAPCISCMRSENNIINPSKSLENSLLFDMCNANNIQVVPMKKGEIVHTGPYATTKTFRRSHATMYCTRLFSIISGKLGNIKLL